ncbi:hypothetical protein ACFZCT_01030 [Streptomyces qaidamensis]|uniref:hypothetical protein n=1 Tax=Streptomyces qaidamensis TaxID=1783515 RepID=UPI0036E137B8
MRTLLTSGRLTVRGRALGPGLARTLDGWLREDVPPAAPGRARTAAALHRTERRLRNAAPAPAAALVRYADVLADAPAEPYALAGWIVARTILGPGRAGPGRPPDAGPPEELLEPSSRV